MKTPREIYAAYKTMPALQLHQLRVAAVGKLICDGFTKSINTRDVILACLFHDMGNILKFDLAVFPEFTQPEGAAYWESVKAEYRAKYGSDQHTATEIIAREIGMAENVITYMKAVDFTKLDETLKVGTVEMLICEYADMRVSPHGVVDMERRLQEGRDRYLARGTAKECMADSSERFETLMKAALEIEQQIFASAQVKPEDINDATVAPFI